jgi:L-lactate utilization protein LutB
MPEIHRGGKHKRACDSCASIRKACNGENPCSECIQRERQCTYQRLYEDLDTAGSTSDADTVMNAESQRTPTAEMAVDVPDRQDNWDLGPQNFYPTASTTGRIVYSRNRYGT